MNEQDKARIEIAVRQLQVLWLGFATSPVFSAIVLLLVLPARPSEGVSLFTGLGLLSALPTVPMAVRFRKAFDAFVQGRVTEPAAAQRALIFGAMTAEIPMFFGIAQFALRAEAAPLLLLCGVSFVLTLMLRPRRR